MMAQRWPSTQQTRASQRDGFCSPRFSGDVAVSLVMTITLGTPLIVAAVGLLVYGMASGKASTAGLVAYGAGLLGFFIRLH